jgi:enoyl-CoA hydratase/carnithine racemase
VNVDTAGVATVTLNRPKRRNAVTLAMWRQLGEAFLDLAERADTRVVVLTGAGGHFCAGADISEFGAVRSTVEQGHAYEQAVDGCTGALMQLRKPTIAAISGYAVGGGCGLALACDFRVADATAQLGIPAARLGIVYGPVDCRNLLSLVGLSRAKEVLFAARRYDAASALRIGLVDHVVDDLAAGVRALAEELAGNAPLAIAGAKLVLETLARGETERRIGEIHAAVERALESEDYREGVRAFGEKRRPRFTGR